MGTSQAITSMITDDSSSRVLQSLGQAVPHQISEALAQQPSAMFDGAIVNLEI